ncbi:MAG: PLP-dependent transferase [Bacteroidota bacterium]
MNPYLQHIPLGEPLPLNNPHAVSVSLPAMSDVIGYEENNPIVKNAMKSGYPRFFTNKLVDDLCKFVRLKNQISEEFELLPLMSEKSLEIIKAKFNLQFTIVEESGSVFLKISKEDDKLSDIKDFIRHTGLLLSSRKAEDILCSLSQISAVFEEEISTELEAADIIKSNLCEAYNAESTKNIFLASCGMNAVYAAYEAIAQLNKNTKKQTVIQAGWLYLDTFEIIRKFSSNNILIASATEIRELESKIISQHKTIGAIFTEVPNNPLVECLDLPYLYELCQKYDIPLIVDCTIGTPYNMNMLPYCDVAAESLTKFACGKGDVLMGAIIVNPKSKFANKIKENINSGLISPYKRDEQRLAQNIAEYESRVAKVSENTLKLISYLEKSPVVSQIFSVLHTKSKENFLKIRKEQNSIPGLISVVFDKDLVNYYDNLNLPKGPSLGTEFTLAMPYVYLAHYDLVKTPEGRKSLIEMGLHPELLRISVGVEPIDQLLSVFKDAGI